MIEFLKHTSTRETKLHCFSSKIEYIQFHSIPFHTKGGTRETHIISKLPSIKLPRNNRHITEIVTHSHFLVKYVVKFVCPTYIFGVYVFVSQQKTIDARKTKIGAKRRQYCEKMGWRWIGERRASSMIRKKKNGNCNVRAAVKSRKRTDLQ